MKIIETPKKTYLAAEVTEVAGGMSQLDGAVVMEYYDDNDDLANHISIGLKKVGVSV
jgi:hypothetical protein